MQSLRPLSYWGTHSLCLYKLVGKGSTQLFVCKALDHSAIGVPTLSAYKLVGKSTQLFVCKALDHSAIGVPTLSAYKLVGKSTQLFVCKALDHSAIGVPTLYLSVSVGRQRKHSAVCVQCLRPLSYWGTHSLCL